MAVNTLYIADYDNDTSSGSRALETRIVREVWRKIRPIPPQMLDSIVKYRLAPRFSGVYVKALRPFTHLQVLTP